MAAHVLGRRLVDELLGRLGAVPSQDGYSFFRHLTRLDEEFLELATNPARKIVHMFVRIGQAEDEDERAVEDEDVLRRIVLQFHQRPARGFDNDVTMPVLVAAGQIDVVGHLFHAERSRSALLQALKRVERWSHCSFRMAALHRSTCGLSIPRGPLSVLRSLPISPRIRFMQTCISPSAHSIVATFMIGRPVQDTGHIAHRVRLLRRTIRRRPKSSRASKQAEPQNWPMAPMPALARPNVVGTTRQVAFEVTLFSTVVCVSGTKSPESARAIPTSCARPDVTRSAGHEPVQELPLPSKGPALQVPV